MPEARIKVGGWPLTVAIIIVVVFLFFIRKILLPFILAAALAFIVTPVIDAIHRRSRIPRWIAAVGVYLALLALFGLLGYWVGGVLVRDVAQIANQLPQLIQKLIADLAVIASRVTGQSLDVQQLDKLVMTQLGASFGGGAAVKLTSYGIATVFGVVLMLVLLIYFLISGRQVANGVFWLVPPEYRGEVGRIAAKILPMLWRYFVGLICVVLYTVTTAWIGFTAVFHLPHSVMLAVAVGLLELIPVIGPAVAIALESLIAVQQSSLLGMVGLICFAVLLRLSIDQIIAPLLLGRAARVHPVVIIFAFLSGAVLFGIIGLLLAVPVAASIKIILTSYYAEPVESGPRSGGSGVVKPIR